MKKWLGLFTAMFVLAASATYALAESIESDPDLPTGLAGEVDKEAYLKARAGVDELRYGSAPSDALIQARLGAVRQLGTQGRALAPFVSAGTWTPIGPWPIPNGQTTSVSTAISGRVSAICVHPTNPNIVYVGAAQGGVWRSLDGGASWTPIFDNAASLAIGSLALAPSDPSILYVGTGEANGSADSFFGVGLYRIDDAAGAAVLNGPFNPTPTTDIIGAKTFTGRSISKILVDPSDPAIVFCSTAGGIGGMGGEAFGASPPITALRGIYRSTNATSASPSFAKLTVSSAASIAPDVSGNQVIADMIYDPTDATANTILCWANGTTAANNGGIYRTTTAKGAGTFSQTFVTTVSGARGTFAANRVGATTTIIVGTGETAAGTSCTTGSGALRRSVDGGLTWSAKLAGGGGYCGGQCFYDLPVAISPTDANIILIGGAGNSTCSRVYARSVNAGASFTAAGAGDVGLHADAHAIVFAPSNANIVYEGNDGGIWKSTNGGANWTSLNVYPFSASQYQSLDVHPTDPNFSIGGTQDNGTQHYLPNGTWNRVDFGDGGFAVIDQNAPDNSNVRMYHTYFNQRNNVVAYAGVTSVAAAFDGNWNVFGQNLNGILVSENPNFYAPLVRGPGSPFNSIYYATDRLHRSTDGGTTNPVVSQAPIMTSGGLGVPISAVGIAPSDDNVRLVGLNNSTIWGTTTGSSVLVNMTGVGMPVKYIARIAIDPTDPNKAYVCFGGFNIPAGQHVWKTTNLMTGTPTWSASGFGLPDVPVNAFAIDAMVPSRVFAGTDVGVYQSFDGGATWAPFTTGMPVVSVFDMKIQPTSRTLRVATHGRGLFERSLDAPVATQLALVGSEIVNGHPKMTWYSADGARESMKLYRRAIPGEFAYVQDLQADGDGLLTYEDANVVAGRSYEYKIGVIHNGVERMLGQVWVDVPVETQFALRSLSANPARGSLQMSVSLGSSSPASLELVDVTGRRVAGKDLGTLAAGTHRIVLDASGVASGVYFARLAQAGKVASVRVTIVR